MQMLRQGQRLKAATQPAAAAQAAAASSSGASSSGATGGGAGAPVLMNGPSLVF